MCLVCIMCVGELPEIKLDNDDDDIGICSIPLTLCFVFVFILFSVLPYGEIKLCILYLVSISTHHRSAVDCRHVILYQRTKFYPNGLPSADKKMTSCRFSRWRISAILDCRDPIMGSLKSPVKLT